MSNGSRKGQSGPTLKGWYSEISGSGVLRVAGIGANGEDIHWISKITLALLPRLVSPCRRRRGC